MSDQLTESYNLLLDEDSITSKRREGEDQVSSLSTDQYKHLRWLCKNDLFFLTTILGFNKLSVNLHGHLCKWMMASRKERFRLLLLPRGHYKTTIWTIADSIRIILPDDTDSCPHPENLGTNCRVLIGHEKGETAELFLYGITSQFLSNPLLMALFPECVPDRRKHRINRSELELPRTERWNEPTFGTIGVGGRSQGLHYNYIKLDDLIGEEARKSKTIMENTKVWIDNIQSFFVDFTQDHLDFAGTRWAVNDIYTHIMEMYIGNLLRYIRPAEEYNKETETFEPIFPEQFTKESFEIIKRNPIIWAAQYANNPEIYGREFLPEWKRYFEWLPGLGQKRLMTFKGTSRDFHDVGDLDVNILIDPAMSGFAGFLVTGTAANSDTFILEAKKHDWKPPELVEEIFLQVLKWQPRRVSIEEVLFSGLLKPWLESEMRKRRIFFNITPYKTGGKAKDARVRGLASYFANGVIHFHRSQKALEEEYDNFGNTDDYHMLDALAQGPTVWSKPISKAKWQQYRKAEEVILQDRDVLTGY